MDNILGTVIKFTIGFLVFKFVTTLLGLAIIFGVGTWAAYGFDVVEPITKFANVMFDLLVALLLGLQEVAIEITKQIMEQIR